MYGQLCFLLFRMQLMRWSRDNRKVFARDKFIFQTATSCGRSPSNLPQCQDISPSPSSQRPGHHEASFTGEGLWIDQEEDGQRKSPDGMVLVSRLDSMDKAQLHQITSIHLLSFPFGDQEFRIAGSNEGKDDISAVTTTLTQECSPVRLLSALPS
ncbi:hypothetical protein C8J56DRAFT_511088 [Mycena floridula]|nr:hypothetical protein C8J56DRAFT_511088 [Mycena floridula]